MSQERCIIQDLEKNVKHLLPHKPTFWLHFYMSGKGIEWQDESLPVPNYLYHANRGYFIGWQVDGFFATQKGIEYLNDIIGRITISLKECTPQRLLYKPDMKEKSAHYYPKIYKLMRFRSLKSLSKKTHAPLRADSLGGKDYCFWAIKLYTEDLIRQFDEGTPVPYHLIEDWAMVQFDDHKKGQSTVRAKCRSIWNWNDKNNWVLPKHYIKKNQKEVLMTRQEIALKNSEKKAKETREKIINAVTGLFARENLCKKNGSWSYSKIADFTNTNIKTVSKYMKEYEAKTA